MNTKETLKQNYQQYLCELGAEHIDTKVAKTLYDNYCMAEQETFKRCLKWISENIGSTAASDFLNSKIMGGLE